MLEKWDGGMKISLAALGLCLLTASYHPGFSQQDQSAPRVVNVTSDSEKGWVPSEDLERQAQKTANDFMAAKDSGRAEQAYSFLADIDRKDQPFPDFSSQIRQFNAKAGALVERRITTVTWTKNPSSAPLPGIYAAFDLVSRFANVDRHCGYLILYQSPSGGRFQVMREESNYMDNMAAAGFAKQSPAAAEQAWAKLSANCPNYHPAPDGPLAEASSPVIEYPNVAAALAGLHAKQGVVFRNEGGWTVAEDTAAYTIWSFPPEGHPAYPSVVKRQIVQENAGSSIKMSVHCQASKQACDDLVRSFEELNAKMAAGVRGPK